MRKLVIEVIKDHKFQILVQEDDKILMTFGSSSCPIDEISLLGTFQLVGEEPK